MNRYRLLYTPHSRGCRVNGGNLPPSQCDKCTQEPAQDWIRLLMRVDRRAGS